ncbi:MAG: hypothetical protein WCS52_07105 [bacterium]
MKMNYRIARRVVMGILSTGLVMGAGAEEIKVGDTVEVVVKELGKPQGRITSGAYDLYIYPRGKVEFKNGTVTTVELVTEEEATSRRLELEQRRLEAEQRTQEAQDRRRLEGNKVLAERLADTAFRAQSAGDQLAYWDVFRKQYPEIDIGTLYANLARQSQADLDQARIQEQLADLQQRTAAAEARALRAERAAEEAYWSRPPVTYLAAPWIQSYSSWGPTIPPYTSDHPHTKPSRSTVTYPLPATHAGSIPVQTRTIPAVPFSQAGSSISSTGTTLNGKSGPIHRP